MSDKNPQDANLAECISRVKNLEYHYLQELQTVIAGEMSKRKNQAVREAASEVTRIAEKLGMPLEQLLEIARKAKNKAPPLAPVSVKYRHPDDPTKEWTGRGRQPLWIKEWVAANGDLDGITLQAA